MKKISIFIFILTFVLGTFACFDDDCASNEIVESEKTLSFSNVRELKLENITGSIKFIGWDKDSVQVTYLKRACGQELLSRLKVEADQDQNYLKIDTDYPRRCNKCSIKFTVYIPKSFEKVKVRTITGSVSFSEIDYIKMVDADCITGSIKASFSSEKVYLRSITGGITLDLKKVAAEADMKLSLTTGSIKIYVPEDFAGEVDFKTVTGRVSTDFPITFKGNIKRSRLKGTIGNDGSISITARTITGSIKLLKN